MYRGAGAGLQGYYIAADFYSGNFYKIAPDGNGGWTTTVQAALSTGIADFGETENGELYAVSLTSNTIYQVLASGDGPLPVTLKGVSAISRNGSVELNWKTSFEQNLRNFEIEYSSDGINFMKAGTVAAKNVATGAEYVFPHNFYSPTVIYYRLKMIDNDGKYSYSSIVTARFTDGGKNFVYPSVINNRKLTVMLSAPFNSIQLVSLNGSVLMQQKITGLTGNIDMNIPALADGIYLVRLKGNKTNLVQKIIVKQQ